MPAADHWNHNLHYLPLVLGAVPRGADRALDVGCGEGIVARALAAKVPYVTGIDLDATSLRRARDHPGTAAIELIGGDVLTHPFERASFDLVTCVAALHHMGDEGAALVRMADLVRPGGTLVVIGLARGRLPADLPMDLAGAVATRFLSRKRATWESIAPQVWPPPHTFADMRRLSRRVLPGVRYRRHVLWRYSLVWTRPGGDGAGPSGSR